MQQIRDVSSPHQPGLPRHLLPLHLRSRAAFPPVLRSAKNTAAVRVGLGRRQGDERRRREEVVRLPVNVEGDPGGPVAVHEQSAAAVESHAPRGAHEVNREMMLPGTSAL